MRAVLTSFLALTLVSGAGPALAAIGGPGFWTTPTIQGYGKMHYDHRFAYQPDRRDFYKVVFEVTKNGTVPDAVNSGLDHVARALNLYVAAGVPLNHLKFVVILEGESAPVSLSNVAYRQRFGTDNPNLPLIAALRQKGVDIAVCAQAAALHDIPYDAVDQQVTIALSALTTVSTLENKGYGLVPQ
jgi:intracellular sulfur oxidation DsrE/DsrF family protein